MSLLLHSSRFIPQFADWASIVSLLISAVTLFIAGSVNRAIKRVNKKVLVNQKLSEDISCLVNNNSAFVELMNKGGASRAELNTILSKITTRVRIINRYVPKEFVKTGEHLLGIIEDQSKYPAGDDALWEIYNKSVGFVDELTNYSREKDFIS